MKIKQITISKTIKVPIEGISFSNKQVSIEKVYSPEGFDINKANDELNHDLTVLREEDPEWITNPQQNIPIEKKK